MDRRLIINNIGPIKHVDVYLNKINVIIGPQSSGKSTIAKIISFCSWLEKEKNESVDHLDLKDILEKYHRMKGYFSDNSSILYIGDNLLFAYNYTYELPVLDERFINVNVSNAGGNKQFIFYAIDRTINPKVSYIPAERNFVSALPNAKKYAVSDNSLLAFINDWMESKGHYPTDKPMDILNLGVKYYYNENKDRDVMWLDENKVVSLEQASSGIQSLVPLLVMLNWLTNGIYEENQPYSPEEISNLKKLLVDLARNGVSDSMSEDKVKRLSNLLSNNAYTHTQFIIEEPEQNLFPKTQVDFLYYLLSIINHGKPHPLVLTTHSPYILYALNNCLLSYQVKDSEFEGELREYCEANSVNPSTVSVWQLKDGCLVDENGQLNKTIQDANGLIRKNYFNNVMKDVLGVFNELLAYYD